ncbi:MAG: aminotransferase class V-fold PLP-dependent enzyme [Planctomycetales bacterium]|nr:aminotransferase class V-fold PLP-dependent enzyme [Planctomycetales bacterium]
MSDFPRPEHDEDWEIVRRHWNLRPGVTYLNHGSFGPPPRPVIDCREHWRRELDAQPMDVLVQQFEPMWLRSRDALAEFVGASADRVGLVENATQGMNVVAHSFPLAAGDEVLLTNHEYGAVERIWRRRCEQAGAELRRVELESFADEQPIDDPGKLVDRVATAITDRTRLLVVSHITSATALILPVRELIEAAHARNVAVCVDGPHAVAQLPLELDRLGCDFYCASCHKWLSAAFGTGFVYAAPKWHGQMQPPSLSWGRLLPSLPERWTEELMWTGTRDISAWATLPVAIGLLQDIGLDRFRARLHHLARLALDELRSGLGLDLPTLAAPFDSWYGAMAHMELPPGESLPLQVALREQFGIEVPIVSFADRRWLRVSCHLYNTRADIQRLVDGLRQLLK